MKHFIIILSLLAISFAACCQTNATNTKSMKTSLKKSSCKDGCTKGDGCEKTVALTCKLTSPEMRKRRETVIASLKNKVIEKKELDNGYSYKFNGTDTIIDELAQFVKTERLCCDFFDFSLSVKGDGTMALLTITGPEGAKEFINAELQL
jgi:hypothetical protein